MSIYDALGGEAGTRGIVDDLAARLSTDPLLGPLFSGVDHESLQRHRVSYLAAVLGGPEQYGGSSMRDAHRPFGLTDEHMDRFLQLVAESLRAAAVDPESSRSLLELLDRLRPVIVDPTVGGDVTPPAAES